MGVETERERDEGAIFGMTGLYSLREVLGRRSAVSPVDVERRLSLYHYNELDSHQRRTHEQATAILSINLLRLHAS